MFKIYGYNDIEKWIIISTFVFGKRSFELLQNEVKYRISLVSKSLPVKLKYFVSYWILARKKIHYAGPSEMLYAFWCLIFCRFCLIPGSLSGCMAVGIQVLSISGSLLVNLVPSHRKAKISVHGYQYLSLASGLQSTVFYL